MSRPGRAFLGTVPARVPQAPQHKVQDRRARIGHGTGSRDEQDAGGCGAQAGARQGRRPPDAGAVPRVPRGRGRRAGLGDPGRLGGIAAVPPRAGEEPVRHMPHRGWHARHRTLGQETRRVAGQVAREKRRAPL